MTTTKVTFQARSATYNKVRMDLTHAEWSVEATQEKPAGGNHMEFRQAASTHGLDLGLLQLGTELGF